MSTNRLIITSHNGQNVHDISYLSSSRKTGFWNSLVHLIYTIAASIFSSYKVIYVQIGENNATYEYVIDKHDFTEFRKGAGQQNDNFGELAQFIEYANNFIISSHTAKHILDSSFPDNTSSKTGVISNANSVEKDKPPEAPARGLSQESTKVALEGQKALSLKALSLIEVLLGKERAPTNTFKHYIPKNSLQKLQTFLLTFKPTEKKSPDFKKILSLLEEMQSVLILDTTQGNTIQGNRIEALESEITSITITISTVTEEIIALDKKIKAKKTKIDSYEGSETMVLFFILEEIAKINAKIKAKEIEIQKKSEITPDDQSSSDDILDSNLLQILPEKITEIEILERELEQLTSQYKDLENSRNILIQQNPGINDDIAKYIKLNKEIERLNTTKTETKASLTTHEKNLACNTTLLQEKRAFLKKQKTRDQYATEIDQLIAEFNIVPSLGAGG